MTQRIISWILSVLLLAAVGAGAASARVLNVRDFGAKGDGVTDDTKAINAAIAAGVSQGPGTRVLVPTGQYLLLSPTEGAHVHIRRANGLTFEGHKGAVLLADDPNAHIIDLSDSKNTTIRNLTLESDKYYFTQGTCVAQVSATHTVDLRLDLGYPEVDAPQIVSIAHWTIHIVDPKRPGPYEGPPYFTVAPIAEKRVGDRLWRLTFPDFHGWPAVPYDINIVGKKILIWDDRRGSHGISANNDLDCLVEDVNYYGKGVNAGLILSNCTGTMTFRRLNIGCPPGSNGLLSCSGGGQMIDIRGRLVWDHCDFERFDDDGADILTNYVRVLREPDPRTLEVDRGSHYVVGDRLSAVDWTKMQEVAEPQVVSVTELDRGQSRLTLDRDLPALHTGTGSDRSRDSQVNDGIDRVADYNNACQSVLFTHCRFQCNRARPLNLKSQNCVVEDCDFYNCVMSPIEAGPEMWWGEAPFVHNLTIRHNTFAGNKSPDIDVGVFYDKENDCLGMDNSNILIEDNRFERSGPEGALRLRNARNIVVRNNHFGQPASPLQKGFQVVNVSHCEGVALENNEGIR